MTLCQYSCVEHHLLLIWQKPTHSSHGMAGVDLSMVNGANQRATILSVIIQNTKTLSAVVLIVISVTDVLRLHSLRGASRHTCIIMIPNVAALVVLFVDWVINISMWDENGTVISLYRPVINRSSWDIIVWRSMPNIPMNIFAIVRTILRTRILPVWIITIVRRMCMALCAMAICRGHGCRCLRVMMYVTASCEQT